MSNQGPLIRDAANRAAQRQAELAAEKLLNARATRDVAAKSVLQRIGARIGPARNKDAQQQTAFRQAFVEGTLNGKPNAERTRQALAKEAGGKNALDNRTKNALRPMDPQAVSVDRTLTAMAQSKQHRSTAEWNSIAAALDTETVRTNEQTSVLAKSTKAAAVVIGSADLAVGEANAKSAITKEADNLRKNEAAQVKINKYIARFRAQGPIEDGSGRTSSAAELADLELMVEFNDVVETVMAGAKGNPAQQKFVKRAVVFEAVAREASTQAELSRDAAFLDTAEELTEQANASTQAVVTVETVREIAPVEQVRTQEIGVEQALALPPLPGIVPSRR